MKQKAITTKQELKRAIKTAGCMGFNEKRTDLLFNFIKSNRSGTKATVRNDTQEFIRLLLIGTNNKED